MLPILDKEVDDKHLANGFQLDFEVFNSTDWTKLNFLNNNRKFIYWAHLVYSLKFGFKNTDNAILTMISDIRTEWVLERTDQIKCDRDSRQLHHEDQDELFNITENHIMETFGSMPETLAQSIVKDEDLLLAFQTYFILTHCQTQDLIDWQVLFQVR